jgi:hypothetical protein
MVMETSLTTVFAEPPLPEPELPPADCEDDVAEVADVADVDVVADDDVAVDADVVAAALVDAIALIDMKASPGRAPGRSDSQAPCSPLERGRRAKQAPVEGKNRLPRISAPEASNQSLRRALQLSHLSLYPPRLIGACRDNHLVSRPCELEHGR